MNSNSGFTLVEMMIAAGILAVLMLGFTSYMYYQSRMSKMNEAKQNMGYVESTILNSAGQEEAVSRSENLQVSDAP